LKAGKVSMLSGGDDGLGGGLSCPEKDRCTKCSCTGGGGACVTPGTQNVHRTDSSLADDHAHQLQKARNASRQGSVLIAIVRATNTASVCAVCAPRVSCYRGTRNSVLKIGT
jgi:hypothetical protein